MVGRLDFHRSEKQAADARAAKAETALDEVIANRQRDILRAIVERDAHWQRVIQSTKKLRWRDKICGWFRRRRLPTADELCDEIDRMLAGRHPA
jgi:hypothetical protein